MLLSYLAGQPQVVALVAGRTDLKQLVESRSAISASAFVDASQQLLGDVQESMPHFLEISIADSQATIISSTVAESIGVSLSGRPEFRDGRRAAYLGRPEIIRSARPAARIGAADPRCGGRTPRSAGGAARRQPAQSDALQRDRPGQDRAKCWSRPKLESRPCICFRLRGEGRLSVPLAEVPALAAALAGGSGFAAENYEGIPVLAASAPVVVDAAKHNRWALLAKIDRQEAYAPITAFRHLFLHCNVFWSWPELRLRTGSHDA